MAKSIIAFITGKNKSVYILQQIHQYHCNLRKSNYKTKIIKKMCKRIFGIYLCNKTT